jgi:hypothetical protein
MKYDRTEHRGYDMADRQLVFEDFADKVGDVFTIGEPDVPAIALTLKQAEPLNPAWGPKGVRPPFALSFLAADPRVLPQRLYRMAHDGLGEIAIFLVPSAKTAEGVTYHATFN